MDGGLGWLGHQRPWVIDRPVPGKTSSGKFSAAWREVFASRRRRRRIRGRGRKRLTRGDTVGGNMSCSYNYAATAATVVSLSESYDIKSWGLAGSNVLSTTSIEGNEMELLIIAQEATVTERNCLMSQKKNRNLATIYSNIRSCQISLYKYIWTFIECIALHYRMYNAHCI